MKTEFVFIQKKSSSVSSQNCNWYCDVLPLRCQGPLVCSTDYTNPKAIHMIKKDCHFEYKISRKLMNSSSLTKRQNEQGYSFS